MFSYAICVCNEALELDQLLTQLADNKRPDDDVHVLVDTGKVTPEVREVLSRYAVQVHEREFQNDFAAHKNFLNSKCKGDYIFNIDADEVPSEYIFKIIPDIEKGSTDLVYVPRVNIMPGITEGDLKLHNFQLNDSGFINWPDQQGRIYRNDPSIKWEGKLHEKIIGATALGQLPVQPLMALWHVKSRDKYRRQKRHYLEIEGTSNA